MTATGELHTVLLIDDEKIDQMMYRRVIQRSGLVQTVLSFQYADEALEFLKGCPDMRFDAIFLDINMPRMSGFEFLERATAELGEDFAKAVVIMLTTSLDPRDCERARSFGVVKAFFNKPLTGDHLEQVLTICSDR